MTVLREFPSAYATTIISHLIEYDGPKRRYSQESHAIEVGLRDRIVEEKGCGKHVVTGGIVRKCGISRVALRGVSVPSDV